MSLVSHCWLHDSACDEGCEEAEEGRRGRKERERETKGER